MSGLPGVASPFCRTAAYRGTLPGLHALRRRTALGAAAGDSRNRVA